MILNIETSTINCSVSLSHEGEILALKEEHRDGYSHAEKLHLFIDEVLDKGSVKLEQLDAIAVSKGPGSYTGLRIGVSTAKGLCYAASLPLISVSTMEALARKIEVKEGHIIPLLDARRAEVYTAVFDFNFNKLEDTRAEILKDSSFEKQLSEGPVYFIGDAVEKTEAIVVHENAKFHYGLPSSKEMAFLSFRKFLSKDFEDLAYFEPFYLKDFIVIPSKKK